MNVDIVYRPVTGGPWETASTLNLTGDPHRFYQRLTTAIARVEAPGFSDDGPVETAVRFGGDTFPPEHFRVDNDQQLRICGYCGLTTDEHCQMEATR